MSRGPTEASGGLQAVARSLDGDRRYPVSGWTDPEPASLQPFGPDADLQLDDRLTGGLLTRPVPTEAQAERARARHDGTRTEVLAAAANPMRVLTPEEIERDRLRLLDYASVAY